MQLRYCSIVDRHSLAGSAALVKSMHSSRRDFSSLHTQQGYTGGEAAGKRLIVSVNGLGMKGEGGAGNLAAGAAWFLGKVLTLGFEAASELGEVCELIAAVLPSVTSLALGAN